MEQLNYFTELSQATFPHALKGQKPYKLPRALKLLPLQGDRLASMITQGAALG